MFGEFVDFLCGYFGILGISFFCSDRNWGLKSWIYGALVDLLEGWFGR
jgi:hypothetical protein